MIGWIAGAVVVIVGIWFIWFVFSKKENALEPLKNMIINCCIGKLFKK